MSAEDFRAIFRGHPDGVSLITADAGDSPVAVTATSVASISVDPPFFHREKDSIDAHLTVVFAALAIGRHLQELTGLPLKRLITDLKAVRSAKVLINGQVVTFAAQVPDGLEEVLSRLRGGY